MRCDQQQPTGHASDVSMRVLVGQMRSETVPECRHMSGAAPPVIKLYIYEVLSVIYPLI